MAIFKFFIQNTIWQDFSFKVKQCQSYRTAMVFPHAEIDTLKLLYRFMNLSNSEPHSSPWLFFPLISHLHLGTPFWQWSSTVIWEMESSQNSQAHINFDYLFCLLFHIYQFHMRHMILSVYISKYTFLLFTYGKESHFLKTLTIFLEGAGFFQSRGCWKTSCCKTKRSTACSSIFWKYNWKSYQEHTLH